MSTREVIIIGGGPAGYTAAIYAARAGLKPLVIEGYAPLGALAFTTKIENFPGFPGGIDGTQLMEQMRAQAEEFGTELITSDVTAVDLEASPKHVTAGSQSYTARAVILATGAGWRQLGVPGEDKLLGRGVSTCATCDGPFFRDLDVAVVGGGDSAMEEALFLASLAKSVTVIHRRTELRASAIMAERVRAHPKIRLLLETEITEVVGESKVTGLKLRHAVTRATSGRAADGLFLAIGHIPRSDLFKAQLKLDEDGYVVLAGSGTATSLPGVFAAGDLVDRHYRQAVTAAGSGCAAVTAWR
jgi:thioredoxin reductase (NADPH)